MACPVNFLPSRRQHTTRNSDWSADVCSSDLVTFVLFHPLAFAAGAAAALAVGAVLSIFTAGVVNVALLPALSVTVTLPRSAERRVGKESRLACAPWI